MKAGMKNNHKAPVAVAAKPKDSRGIDAIIQENDQLLAEIRKQKDILKSKKIIS